MKKHIITHDDLGIYVIGRGFQPLCFTLSQDPLYAAPAQTTIGFDALREAGFGRFLKAEPDPAVRLQPRSELEPAPRAPSEES